MSNDSIVKAHCAAVRADVSKVIRLKNEYGLTLPQLAKRFEVSEHFIKLILKEAKG